VLFPSHQAKGGCYASTVKPVQVALVKPVVYLKTELETAFPTPFGPKQSPCSAREIG
jgi:hypothetical protein